MRKYLLIALGILAIIFFIWLTKPTDILKDYPDHSELDPDGAFAENIMVQLENAYGGRANWEQWQYGKFIQSANWYGRLRMSGWDTIPQLYSLNTKLRSYDCELTLLGGPRKGKVFNLENQVFHEIDTAGNEIPSTEDHFADKMIFKSYWFQFPFRVADAEIIRYWGEQEIEGKTYQLLYATWGSLKANKDFDQFMLYLDKETHLIEILHFTVRDKIPVGKLTAVFQDFREVQNLTLPYSQYVRMGSPMENRLGMHENHYEYIEFK